MNLTSGREGGREGDREESREGGREEGKEGGPDHVPEGLHDHILAPMVLQNPASPLLVHKYINI